MFGQNPLKDVDSRMFTRMLEADGRKDGSVTISLCNFVGEGIKSSHIECRSLLAPFNPYYLGGKIVSKLNNESFIRNIHVKKKVYQDCLKNKRSAYKNTLFDTFGPLVSFVHLRSTKKQKQKLSGISIRPFNEFSYQVWLQWLIGPVVSEEKFKNRQHHLWHLWASSFFCVYCTSDQ